MFLTRLTIISIVQLLIVYCGRVTCTGCNNGDYVSDPYDCNGFLQCQFGRWAQRSCPRDLHFNPVNQVCDFPWNSNCVIDSTSKIATTTTTTTTITVTPDPDEPPTSPSTPTTTSTSTSAPTTTSTSTPAPTTTSTSTPAPTTTSTSSTSAPTVTFPTSTTSFPTNPPSLNCPRIDGQFVVHLPHRNCSMFYKCVHGIPHEMFCPFGQHWAIFLDRCDSPSEANCIEGAASEQENARPPNYW